MESDSSISEGKPKVETLKTGNDFELCSQCRYLNKTTKNDLYCFTCHQCFCSECSEILHAFEVNKNHCLIGADELNKNTFYKEALELLDKFVTCPVHHGKSVIFHCGEHDEMFCGVCICEKHRYCTNVKYISDLEEQYAEIKTAVLKLSSFSTKLEGHIDSVTNIVKENDVENKKTLDTVLAVIHEVKQKVIKIFDAMEDNLNQEGKAMVKEVAIKNHDEIQELNGLTNNLKILTFFLDKIAPKIRPETAYICIYEAKKSIARIEQTVTEKWSNRLKLGIELKKETLLDSVLDLGINQTSLLASINQTETKINLPAFHGREIMLEKVEVKKSGVIIIVPKGANYEKDPQPTYNDFVFLQDGSFLITDSYNGLCCMVDNNLNSVGCYSEYADSVEDTDDNLFNPRYASYLKEGMLAISVASANKICLVTADENLTHKGEIKCQFKPRAIHVLNNKDLAVAWDDPVAFGILSGMMWSCEEIYFTSDKTGRTLKSFEYMAVDEKRCHVIQPCTIDKAVYCFDFKGQPVFQYSSKKLQDPTGVGLDCKGNIFVIERKFKCIHVLSSAGQVLQIINEDCPEQPLAIGFQRDGKTFAVTQCADWYSVHFFSITAEENDNI